jgi:guanylate kinase
MKNKVLIFSAPSGAGKTTIVHNLLSEKDFKLEFSVSACSRKKRNNETEGEDYYFLSVEDFKKKISNDEFLEWEEVYENNYYGSLKSEVERIGDAGFNVVFDVDVKGGLNIKEFYGKNALAVFVMPPSIEVLESRLRKRSTDNEQSIRTRVEKAKYEIGFAKEFDIVIINDNLDNAIKEVKEVVSTFLK